jgi:hypothetical protein
MPEQPDVPDLPLEEPSRDDVDPELVARLGAIASEPHASIVAYLREHRVSVTALLAGAYALEDRKQQLALYLALFDVRPSVPDAEVVGAGRASYLTARSDAASCALSEGDVELANRLLAPVLGFAPELPSIAHNAACGFALAGRGDDALAQIEIAATSNYREILDVEVDPDLASLFDLPAFQEIFRRVREERARQALSLWPAGIPIPPRLLDIARFLTAKDSWGCLDDYELGPLYDDYLANMWAQDESDAFLRDFAEHPPAIAFFMRDGGGGQLGLWLVGDPAHWPVVSIDSEASHEVIGEDLDDFLRRMAGKWMLTDEDDDADVHEGIRAWQKQVQAWIRSLGLEPYAQPDDRLEPLARRTLEFERWCGEQQRAIRGRVFPDRPTRFEAVPGERVGPVRLGAPQAEVDAALGTPKPASWQKKTDPSWTAFYAASPYVVRYARATGTVREVTIYGSWPVVVLPGGFEPLFATIGDTEAWIRAQGKASRIDDNDLVCDELGLTFRHTCAPARSQTYPANRWVDAITFRAPGGD